MFGESLQESICSGRGGVLICAGSGSDAEHIQKLGKALQAYDIPFEVKICSAHKQPRELMDLIDKCNAMQGALAYIAVAGGTDALSGILSFHAVAPVISCPPDGPNSSCLNNPSGSSNATIFSASNAARFVAQLFSYNNPTFRTKVLDQIAKKVKGLEESDREYRKA